MKQPSPLFVNVVYGCPQAKELACDKAIDLLFDSAVVLVADLENEKNDLIKEFARELLKEIMHFKLYQRKIGDSFWNLILPIIGSAVNLISNFVMNRFPFTEI